MDDNDIGRFPSAAKRRIGGERFCRTAIVLGEEAIERLGRARVVVFGLGGVGSYAVEALARSGIGALDLIDADTVEESNINRQLYALSSTIGRAKVEVARERIEDINSGCKVRAIKAFYLPEGGLVKEIASRVTQEGRNRNDNVYYPLHYDGVQEIERLFDGASYVVDAVDTVAAKAGIILAARAAFVPVISAMGTGNKVDPALLRIDDISKTTVCPLARAVRHALKARGVTSGVDVVYSTERPVRGIERDGRGQGTVGSVSFVPPVAGMMMAGRVVRRLCR